MRCPAVLLCYCLYLFSGQAAGSRLLKSCFDRQDCIPEGTLVQNAILGTLDVTVELSNAGSECPEAPTNAILRADLNHDGYDDLVVIGWIRPLGPKPKGNVHLDVYRHYNVGDEHIEVVSKSTLEKYDVVGTIVVVHGNPRNGWDARNAHSAMIVPFPCGRTPGITSAAITVWEDELEITEFPTVAGDYLVVGQRDLGWAYIWSPRSKKYAAWPIRLTNEKPSVLGTRRGTLKRSR